MCVTKVELKNAIYFAIESGNIEIVQALIDTKQYWGKAFTRTQIKDKYDVGPVTITTCFAFGGYIPSSYAKELGFPEIQKILKAKVI